jgi:phosphopantothenoylcysteine decarboxylase/phosphopantothenate--cysteine ligase
MAKLDTKKNILLAVTGSIAAYKSVELARLYITRGFNVRCILTQSARQFVTPLTFEAITANPVMTDLWTEKNSSEIEHIEFADWADILVVAPATADAIAKLNYGFADSAFLATALATRAPILIAPAMNVNMYENQKTRENIEQLKARGVFFVDPEEGDLACGWKGAGRLARNEEIFKKTKKLLTVSDLSGKRVLISTGPTREEIDPVRFISNRSSGKMGAAIADEAYFRGAEVTLVHGPVSTEILNSISSEIRTIPAMSAEEMKNIMLDLTYKDTFSFPHYVIMAAAVSDFRPREASTKKIKKGKADSKIELLPNDDILKILGEKKGNGDHPFLVGFAVETGDIEELLSEVEKKLKAKNVDLMVGNFAQDAFGLDTNRVWLLDKQGRRDEIATSDKSQIAGKIIDAILRH